MEIVLVRFGIGYFGFKIIEKIIFDYIENKINKVRGK